MIGQVEVVERGGTAAELHALDPFRDGPPDSVEVWLCRADAPALVLGSRQSPDLVDAGRCRSAGLAVAGRRSGGGAVVVRPGEVVWIDIVVPPGAVADDVRTSMRWAGEVWRDALTRLGAPPGSLQVHDGGMVTTPWSDLVCFAGTGPGEVLTGGRKLVGLSQRRTRHGVRFQAMVHRAARLADMVALFAGPVPEAPLGDPATIGDVGVEAADDEVAVGLVEAIRRSPS